MVALKIEEEEGGFNQQWKRHLKNFKNKQKIDVPKIVFPTFLPPTPTCLLTLPLHGLYFVEAELQVQDSAFS
jgi:hypothetical protein